MRSVDALRLEKTLKRTHTDIEKTGKTHTDTHKSKVIMVRVGTI